MQQAVEIEALSFRAVMLIWKEIMQATILLPVLAYIERI